MLGQVDHDDCLSNTHEGYIGFCAQLCPLSFKHLGSSLTLLTLEASIWAPIGCSGSMHIPWPLNASYQLPALRQLRLDNCFIDNRLIAFLECHNTNLETHHLRNWMSTHDGTNPSSVPWSTLFTTLTSASHPFPDLTWVKVLPVKADFWF